MMNNNVNKIILLLVKKKEGLTITDIVNETHLSRSLIRTCLAHLEGARKVKFRRVGMAKIYVLRGKK
jgi:DNA-binding transcriptional regulator GbsR (MarR family)